jgi:hypothetical protein
MPDVTGMKLDAAKGDIEGAGYDDDVEVEGGGLFGVIKESNWEVCAQSPAPGKPATGSLTLTVDRSCDEASDDEPEATEPEASEPEASEPEASEPEASEPDATEPEPTETEATEPEATESEEPTLALPITAKNNEELAAILSGDNCGPAIARFAKQYKGLAIRFDGSFADVAPHGSTRTRLDILIGAGDKGPMFVDGPSFKFEDVNAFDLNLTGKVPDYLRAGQRYTFEAEVVEYRANQCLFFLRPIKTLIR